MISKGIKNTITKKLRPYLILISVLGASALYFFGIFAYNNYIEMRSERDSYRNNSIAYEERFNGAVEANRVLRLNRDDLRHSNDSLIVSMEKLRKSLKKPQNKPGDVSIGTVTGIDVTDTVYIDNPCNFSLDTAVFYSKETIDSIKIKNNKLITRLLVNNTQILYVYESSEYKNKYKNGFIRLLNLDWKKETNTRYIIDNSNKDINVKDMVVYKIRE